MKLREFFKKIFHQLVTLDDAPHKIAFGFGLGVFLGILPGTGPAAALAISFIFKVNRLAAVTGSLLTNTWLSVAAFVFAAQIGSFLLGLKTEDVISQCKNLFENFHWKYLLTLHYWQDFLGNIFSLTFWSVVKPLMVGFAVVGIVAGSTAYIFARVILMIYRRKRKGQ